MVVLLYETDSYPYVIFFGIYNRPIVSLLNIVNTHIRMIYLMDSTIGYPFQRSTIGYPFQGYTKTLNFE